MLLPLHHYTDCRDLNPPRKADGGNCRHGYGIPIVECHGSLCAYCGKDMAESYDAWLDLSVDHVVPECAFAKWGEECRGWSWSYANVVPCCRACNEFLNGYRVRDSAPTDKDSFLNLRDKVLEDKRRRALDRHEQEQRFYVSWHKSLSDKMRKAA
jgi:hypothetical protein